MKTFLVFPGKVGEENDVIVRFHYQDSGLNQYGFGLTGRFPTDSASSINNPTITTTITIAFPFFISFLVYDTEIELGQKY